MASNFQQKPNTGSLFKNDPKGNANAPMYKGTVNIDGRELQIAAWLKTSKNGTKYMSLAFQPKRPPQYQARPNQAPQKQDDWGEPNDGESIPF